MLSDRKKKQISGVPQREGNMQQTVDVGPQFVNRSLWCYIEGGNKFKYCVKGDFLFTDFHGR
jgi:hypothetical protein